MAGRNGLFRLYLRLLKKHGEQGWWPVLRRENNRWEEHYHPKDYACPQKPAQKFEIAAGAVLAQNVAWKNAAKALAALKQMDALAPGKILRMRHGKLAEALKPAGYFNQKAKKLKKLAKFWLKLQGRAPKREELLAIWGVGEETADSILLYAFGKPEFVVDAYTRKICGRGGESYAKIKAEFEKSLPKNYKIFNEFHALLVREGKLRIPARKP